MKKILLLCLFVLLSSEAFAWNNVLMTATQKSRWEAMRDANHTYYQDLANRASAAPGTYFGDYGQYDAMMCELHGNSPTNWCEQTWNHIVDFGNYRGRDSYNLGGIDPHNDTLRENYIPFIMIYSSICQDDRAGATNCANFYDLLNYWADNALNLAGNSGYRLFDSDRSLSSHSGSTTFADVIKDEEPERSEEILNHCGAMLTSSGDTYCHGGFDLNNPPSGGPNLRRLTVKEYLDASDYYINRADFRGGVYKESSTYNFGGFRHLMRHARINKLIRGKDYYPELTSQLENMAEAIVNMSVWDFSQFYLWGVAEDTWFNSYKSISSTDLISEVYQATEDPRIGKLFVTLYTDRGTGPFSGMPFLALWDGITQTTPSGQTDHYANGRGILYWHEDWTANDTFFISEQMNRGNEDHEFDYVSSFGLWKNGDWVVYHPSGILDNYGSAHQNTLLIYGGIGTSFEAAGSYAQATGSNYAYHVGGHGGNPNASDSVFTAPKEIVREMTSSHFMRENADGSTTVVQFYRVHTCGDPTNDAECEQDNWTNGRINAFVRNRSTAASYKHQFLFLSNEASTITGSGFNYTAPTTDEVYYYPFIPGGYTTAQLDLCDIHTNSLNTSPYYINSAGNASAYCNNVFDYQTRIIPNNNTDPFETYQIVMHVGSTPTLTEVFSTANKGENVQGMKVVTGAETWTVLFSAQQSVPHSPTPTTPSATWKYSSTRFKENAGMRLLHRGFSVDVSAGSVYLADLDPRRTWKYTIDGGSEQSLTVDAGGFATFTATAGTLRVYNTTPPKVHLKGGVTPIGVVFN